MSSSKDQLVLAVEMVADDTPDKKKNSITRESRVMSTDKKSDFLTVETGLSFTDKGQNSITVETEPKIADKRNSAAEEETRQRQADASCNAKKRSSVTIETVTYEVQENDTLTSISARFDMAPSELKQLNKLMTGHIYTKQKLLIYAKNFFEAEERDKAQKIADKENRRNSGFSDSPRSRHSSAASDLLRRRHPSGRQDDLSDGVSEKSVDRIVSDIKRNRLRLEAKHVTDGQGVVSGTLLVTTNTIMFDPNVSDRLVIDLGRNPYVMVAPFDNVVRLAIVDDIAAMKWQRNSDIPPPKIYCGDHSCDNVRELPSHDEVMSSPDSAYKRQSSLLTNNQSIVNSETTVNGQNGKDLLIASSSRKMTGFSTLDGRCTLEAISPQLNSIYDRCTDSVVRNSNSSNILVTKNCANVHQEGPCETSPRPGLFVQRRSVSNASYALFPIEDAVSNGDAFQPSSLPTVDEFSTASHTSIVGSPMVKTDSHFSCSYDVSRGFARHQSFAASFTEKKDSLLGRRQSLSNVIDWGQGTPSRFVPVYSAKCVPRIASSLKTVESFGSFCVPPGQSYIVDLTWDQFGGMKVEDGFCVSIYDLPPIIDEDAQRMEKPDFFISDDEDADVPPEISSKESENVDKKSSEVDVVKLLKSTDELFKSLDVLIPRPAAHYEDLPWYLCVVIGCPVPSRNSKGAASLELYSVENMKPSYWFSIHRCDVHPLYEFIVNHFPSIYGSEDEINPSDRGLMVLSQEAIKSKQEISSACQFFFDDEDNQYSPSFSEESQILDASQISKLNSELFPRGKDCYWKLIYSNERDGTSLQTLYRKMSEFSEHDPPCIVLIRDSSRTVFGVALTCTIKRSHEYFGNGESFLFSFKDGFKKYSASCLNDYYAYGYKDSLCFGASRGKCGLWIDGDLHHGRTQECATYNNDILTMTEDFYIHQCEAYCLV